MWTWIEQHLSIDPISFPVALIALFIALREWKRNTRPALRVMECKGGFRQDLQSPSGSDYFRVKILNEGISLHNVTVELQFKPEQFPGGFSIGLPIARETNAQKDLTTFVNGMIGDFEFRTDAFMNGPPLPESFPGWTNDPVKEKAAIVVKSQGMEVGRFPVQSTAEFLKRSANRCISLVNRYLLYPFARYILRKEVFVDFGLPHFNSLQWQISQVRNSANSTVINSQRNLPCRSQSNSEALRLFGAKLRDVSVNRLAEVNCTASRGLT